MKSLLLPLAILFTGSALAADVSAQRALYGSVNRDLPSMEKRTATVDGASVTGWFDNGDVRKITASDGGTKTEFYLRKGRPAFVFLTTTKPGSKPAEERIYFDGDEIIEWLNTDKSAPVMHAEDYASFSASLRERAAAYTNALKRGAKASAGELRTTEGKFLGIEQGDYAHWKMQTTDGREVSYFVLRPDASVDKVVDNPNPFVGRKCRVSWKTTTENFEEAGGKVTVDQIVSVEWLK